MKDLSLHLSWCSRNFENVYKVDTKFKVQITESAHTVFAEHTKQLERRGLVVGKVRMKERHAISVYTVYRLKQQ